MVLKEERLHKIIEWIKAENHLSVKDLSARLQVSTMTVWRDLGELEKAGEIRRVRGGAARSLDPLSEEPFFVNKTVLNSAIKCNIGQYAAENLVGNNQIIILEGHTVGSIVPFLDKASLTVLTNGLNTLVAASQMLPSLNVISCGGMLRQKSLTFVGPQAEMFFENFHADQFFLGASGITLEEGITDPNPLEIQIKRTMHRAARRTVLLLDSTKFGRRSLAPILPLQEIDVRSLIPMLQARCWSSPVARIEVHIACNDTEQRINSHHFRLSRDIPTEPTALPDYDLVYQGVMLSMMNLLYYF
jgi:DeoR/GlpR family transcriptional regulator of sugar metabolism